MKPSIQKLLLPIFVMSFMGINSVSALTIKLTPKDRIPSNQCSKTSCQLPIASEDPCGEGGVTVLDSSGSPSCEPIARIVPVLTKKLREAANQLEYKLYKFTGTDTTIDNFVAHPDTTVADYQLCCDANDNCSPAPALPGVCPNDWITTDCDDENNCEDQE